MDDQLYDAILAAPEDDAPRLVYADRLSEQGDPRGEFITMQCMVARLARDRQRNTAEYRAAKARSDSLFRAHESEWFEGEIGLGRWEKKVTRGFISHAFISAKALKARWDRFGRMPLEEVVFHRRLTSLNHGPLGCPEIGRVAWLMRERGGRRLRTFGLTTNTGATRYDPALLAPALASVTDDDETLSWPDDHWPDPRLWGAMQAFSIISHGVRARFIHDRPAEMDRLEVVSVRCFESDEAIAFLDRPNLPHLRELTLESRDKRGGFEASVIRHLVRSPVLSAVSLKVDATLTEELVRALEERATNLEVLNLAVGATEAGLRAFVASSLPRRLRSLTINYSTEAISARPLAETAFEKLETLRLDGFTIDDDVGRAFAANPAFASVVDAHFSYAPSIGALTAIAESPHWNAAWVTASFHGVEADAARRDLLTRRWGWG